MQCPVCSHIVLEKLRFQNKVDAAVCSNCFGAWLDKGKLYAITLNPEILKHELNEKMTFRAEGSKICPQSGDTMSILSIFEDKVEMDFCIECNGFWVDQEDVKILYDLSEIVSPEYLEKALGPADIEVDHLFDATTGPEEEASKLVHTINGVEAQTLEVDLIPGDVFISKPYAINIMDANVSTDLILGDGSPLSTVNEDQLFQPDKEVTIANACVLARYENKGSQKKSITLGASYPGQISELNLAHNGGLILCPENAFLACTRDASVVIEYDTRCGSDLYGTRGFVLYRVKGGGSLFIHGGGVITRKSMRGNRLKVDPGCIAAMTAGVKYKIEPAEFQKTKPLTGVSTPHAILSGVGTVWFFSFSLRRFSQLIAAG